MEKRTKIIVISIIVAAVGVFGFIQYLSVSQLHVSIIQSKVVDRTSQGTLYNLQLQFNNPSLLFLTVGRTSFAVSANGENLGNGVLQPSVIPAMGKTVAQTPFLADTAVLDKYNNTSNVPSLVLTGTSQYNVLFTTVSIPFTYYPTQDQSRAFIDGT
jgi:LEA14-like dessication related protein